MLVNSRGRRLANVFDGWLVIMTKIFLVDCSGTPLDAGGGSVWRLETNVPKVCDDGHDSVGQPHSTLKLTDWAAQSGNVAHALIFVVNKLPTFSLSIMGQVRLQPIVI